MKSKVLQATFQIQLLPFGLILLFLPLPRLFDLAKLFKVKERSALEGGQAGTAAAPAAAAAAAAAAAVAAGAAAAAAPAATVLSSLSFRASKLPTSEVFSEGAQRHRG